MQVQITKALHFTTPAAPYPGCSYRLSIAAPGSIVDIDDDKAQALIERDIVRPFMPRPVAAQTASGD